MINYALSQRDNLYYRQGGNYGVLYAGYSYGMGYLSENAVYSSLRRVGYQVYAGTIKDTEVDFVAIKGELGIYLQVRLQLIEEQAIEREYCSLKLIEDNFDKYVVKYG